MLTEKQKKEIIDSSIEKIKENVVDEVSRNAVWQIKQTISEEIDDVVKTYIREHVAPEIVTCLNKNKSQIIDAAIISAETMAVELAKVLSEQLAENLGTSYKRKRILESLFE